MAKADPSFHIHPPANSNHAASQSPSPQKSITSFHRTELQAILQVYGRHVAEGTWCDYAMDFSKDFAVFSIYRRVSAQPLYRVVKEPKRARKQGQYSVLSESGQVLKRGYELAQVLKIFDKKLRLISN